MTLQLESSQVIDRPVDKVFHFFAVDHVRNHPRWDADIELWLDSDAPIQVGTIIHRRNKHSGTPVEGTMEVVEFEPNRAMAVVIREGTSVTRSRVTFEAVNENQTRLKILVEIPGMEKNADTTYMDSMLERSARIRKELMETEI